MIIGKPITLTNSSGSTIPAFSLVSPGATTGTMVLVDSTTHLGVIGTTAEDVAPGASGLVVPYGLAAWMRFTSAVVAGNAAFVSSSTAGRAQTSPGASSVLASGAAQLTQRLGLVVKVSSLDSTLGLVTPTVRVSSTNAMTFGDKTFGPSTWAVYAVDYDGITVAGNDVTASPGVSTTMAGALAAALLTPFKTLERVGQLLPRTCNGANIVVLVRPRAAAAPYRNIANSADQTMDWCNNISGCNVFIRRATLDFVNDSNDKIVCGFLTGTGVNAPGYNPTAGATVNSLPCQLAGGGAASLPVESGGSSAISGFRIRFSATTATVALRNATAMVWKNTASVITCSDDLPAVPATNDVFFLEQAGVVVGVATDDVLGWNGLATTAGFRSNTGVWSYTSPGRSSISGIEATSTFQAGGTSITDRPCGSLLAERTYLDETATAVALGVSIRAAASMNVIGFQSLRLASYFAASHASLIDISAWAPNFSSVNVDTGLGGGSLSVGGLSLARSPGAGNFGSAAGLFPTFAIGSYINTTARRLRVSGPGGGGATGGVLIGNGVGVAIYGVDFSNQTTFAAIRVASSGAMVSIDDVVSPDGGNTLTVVDFAGSGGVEGAVSSTMVVGAAAAVTATATFGDIKLQGGAICSFANLAITNYVDAFNNNVMGAAGNVVAATRTMQVAVATAAFSVVRMNLAADQVAAAQADSFAHALETFGVTLNATSGAGAVLVAGPGGIVPIQFDSGGVFVNNLSFLSDLTAGQASITPPPMAGTNQKLALGYIVAANGSIGYVAFEPELQPVPSNGIIGASRFFFNWLFTGNPDPTGSAPMWLAQSSADQEPMVPIEYPIDESITQIIIEGWLPTYGWGADAPTLKITKNGVAAATAYLVDSGTAGTVQFAVVVQSYARGDRLGLQLGSFGGGATTGSSLFTGRVFVVP